MNPTRLLRLLGLPALALSVLLFAACGGQDASSQGAQGKSNTSASATTTDATPVRDAFEKAAALNRAELARAAVDEKRAVADSKTGSGQRSAGVVKFVAGTRVPVYRFYVPARGAHFYTASEAEKQAVQASLSASYLYEGIAFYVSSSAGAGLSPVSRYYNQHNGTHFYTISDDERAYIAEYLPGLIPEGIAFYASQTAGEGLLPVARFMQRRYGNHLYTANAAESQSIRNTLSAQYIDEGVAFYVIDPAGLLPASKLPHSGVSDQYCYEAGSSTLVACASTSAKALNSQQDGHRTDINPMSYSEVPKPSGGYFARTECVKDNVTGLIWEGKEASGERAGSNTYTNYDDPNQPQKWDGNAYINPSQGDIDAASNSAGYVNYVNSIALCGFTDWRLPTVDELQGVVDYGTAFPFPMVDVAWSPNVWARKHWSSSPDVGQAGFAWFVGFYDGFVFANYRYQTNAVRLVRVGQ